MTDLTFYHNPRCSKSRAALSLLQVRDVNTKVIDYQATPPNVAEIRNLLHKLGAHSPRAMMRTGDSLYAELNLAAADNETLIAAMAAHPQLIERPIAVVGERAAIGRPLENIEALLS